MLPLLFSYCSMQVQASVHLAAGSMPAECGTCCSATAECWRRALLEGGGRSLHGCSMVHSLSGVSRVAETCLR